MCQLCVPVMPGDGLPHWRDVLVEALLKAKSPAPSPVIKPFIWLAPKPRPVAVGIFAA